MASAAFFCSKNSLADGLGSDGISSEFGADAVKMRFLKMEVSLFSNVFLELELDGSEWDIILLSTIVSRFVFIFSQTDGFLVRSTLLFFGWVACFERYVRWSSDDFCTIAGRTDGWVATDVILSWWTAHRKVRMTFIVLVDSGTLASSLFSSSKAFAAAWHAVNTL